MPDVSIALCIVFVMLYLAFLFWYGGIGIVRYRSRRDMLKMAIEVAALGMDIHKWAAPEKTQVFPVKPLLHLAFVWMIVAALLLAFALIALF